MTPPIALSRWLGGKRWLTAQHPDKVPLPRRGRRAYDCFAGSCVVAFWWLAQGFRVVIGDTNARLIGCLRNLKERPEAVIAALTAIESAHHAATDRKADFIARRGYLNREDAADAGTSAVFLFVLRAGFNGLYRENLSGACNVPYGDPWNDDKSGQRQHIRNKDLVRADELRAISALLQRADIRLGDFAATSADARSGDALFADAPYAAPGAFVGYSKGGFGLKDRQRLAAWLREMDRRGVRWTATDAATDHTIATYGLWTVDRAQVRRSVSAKSEGRGHAEEALIRNWQSATAKGAA